MTAMISRGSKKKIWKVSEIDPQVGRAQSPGSEFEAELSIRYSKSGVTWASQISKSLGPRAVFDGIFGGLQRQIWPCPLQHGDLTYPKKRGWLFMWYTRYFNIPDRNGSKTCIQPPFWHVYHIYNSWLVVWNVWTPLKNMSSSVGMINQPPTRYSNWWKNIASRSCCQRNSDACRSALWRCLGRSWRLQAFFVDEIG